MLPSLLSSTALPVLAVLFAVGTAASPHHKGIARRHHQLSNHFPVRDLSSGSGTPSTNTTRPRKRRSCIAPSSASSSAKPSSSIASTKTASKTAKSTSSTSSPAPVAAGGSESGSESGSDVGSSSNGKPSDWPTATQAGAAPAATRTSPADPFLLELSKAYNNADNPLFTGVHTGDMTFYGQGLGACGDTYDDSSFTAAVSRLMYDAWPGATAGEMNRNPICGPFVPGRKAMNQAGVFETVVPGSEFVDIGGDGLLNCDAESQCHIPLTATVTHGGKSIIVKIVDRCEACAQGSIDLTPAAFAALADQSLGRTSVSWHFNNY